MARQLEGKVALITGAASGIGRAVAERFLEEGARVVAFDLTASPASGLTTPDYVSIAGDVRSSGDNQRAVALALSTFGRLDVFVGNAGVYDNRRVFRGLQPAELEAAFDELFAVNVKGYMLGAHAALHALSETRGCIIFTGSISGTHAGFGGALYVSAKHAINGLTKQLALELAPDIRVNAVAPGYVPTGLRAVESFGQHASASHPAASDMLLQTIGTPEDFAAAYVFLASEACSRTATGSVLTLDGGATLRGPRT
jgi:NAD(P)-dependent dehydrogenase (short-subunit alcohol dehydrogenase family)